MRQPQRKLARNNDRATGPLAVSLVLCVSTSSPTKAQKSKGQEDHLKHCCLRCASDADRRSGENLSEATNSESNSC